MRNSKNAKMYTLQDGVKTHAKGKGGDILRRAFVGGAVGLVALCGTIPAMAMGLPVNGGMVMLEPDTLTVTGIASEPITNPVYDISYTVNISDITFRQITHDATKLISVIEHSMMKIGVSRGDLIIGTPSMNSGNSGSTESLQFSIIVSKQASISSVYTALTNDTTSQVQNSYSNIQIVPLNPSVIWKHLYAKAIDNARQQAMYLAKEAGNSLGEIMSISTVPQQGYLQTVSGPYPTSPAIVGILTGHMQNGTTIPTVSAELFVTFAMTPKTST